MARAASPSFRAQNDDTKSRFRTKREAEAYGREKGRAAKLGLVFDAKAGKAALRDIAQEWMSTRADLKATTLQAYRDALAPSPTTGRTAARHKRLAPLRIDAVFGPHPVNKIT